MELIYDRLVLIKDDIERRICHKLYLTDAGVNDHHGLNLVGKLVQEDGNAAVFVDAQRDLQRLFAIQKH